MANWNQPRWSKQWQMERARGLKRMGGTDAVRAHIQYLLDKGFTCGSIADTAGVERRTVGWIHRGRQMTVHIRIARKILAVTPDAIYSRPMRRGYVPDAGAIRRIEALMTMGWRYKDLTPMLGFPAATVKAGGGWVSQYKHEAIVALYERLWNTQGPAPRGTVSKALKRGFAPPMAWDDDTIDDPAAEPDGIRTEAA